MLLFGRQWGDFNLLLLLFFLERRADAFGDDMVRASFSQFVVFVIPFERRIWFNICTPDFASAAGSSRVMAVCFVFEAEILTGFQL